jgi:hypothetical protein
VAIFSRQVVVFQMLFYVIFALVICRTMAEDDIEWKYWFQFLKRAGVPKRFCPQYASSFCANYVKVKQLKEAVKEDNDLVFVFLKRVGVDMAGHVMMIRAEV